MSSFNFGVPVGYLSVKEHYNMPTFWASTCQIDLRQYDIYRRLT